MLLEARNLNVGYHKKIVAQNLNFKVEEGDVLCILGHNGAGKTTLLKTILRMIKPISGEIIYGKRLENHRFGYLPQMSENQDDFPAIVKEIVLSGCINRSRFKLFFNKNDRRIAERSMALLGIQDLENRPFSTLSGGQKQRVLIARALCATDKIIFLDEPLTGLDPQIVNDFYQIVKELHENHITVVMISHETKESIELSNQVLYLGDSVIFQSKEEFVSSALGKAYLEGGVQHD